MKEYLKRIINNDTSIIHGVYEPPNNIPILRYKVNKENYKVIVLGSTDMKLSCLRWLSTENIKPYYVFDSIEQLDEIDKNNKYFLVISDESYKYSTYQSKLIERLSKNNIEYYLCPYDYEKIPKHETEYLKYFIENEEKILSMVDLLFDEVSKKTYIEYIRSKAFCDFYRETQKPTWIKYFDQSVYQHIDEEVFINCGSSNGDTIFYFLEKFDEFKRIYAFENDVERVKQFKENMKILDEATRRKIVAIRTLVDNDKNKIDEIIPGEVSLINMDIEGMELEALNGARKTIIENKPVIAACAYHLPTDLYELPMYLKELDDDYEIFYRKYASTVRNRFCNAELVMYAVPSKRISKKL